MNPPPGVPCALGQSRSSPRRWRTIIAGALCGLLALVCLTSTLPLAPQLPQPRTASSIDSSDETEEVQPLNPAAGASAAVVHSTPELTLRRASAMMPQLLQDLSHWMFCAGRDAAGGNQDTPCAIASTGTVSSPFDLANISDDDASHFEHFEEGSGLTSSRSVVTRGGIDFKVACVMSSALHNNGPLLEKVVSRLLIGGEASSLGGGPEPKVRKRGTAAVRGGRRGLRMLSNGFFAENLCIPLHSWPFGFGDAFAASGSPRALRFVTEMGTHVRDLHVARAHDVIAHARRSVNRSSAGEMREKIHCSVIMSPSTTAAEAAPRAGNHRSIVVVHPVRRHFNNLYHVVLRLAATLSFLLRASQKRPTLASFIASMTSVRRNTYYSDAGLATCADHASPDAAPFECPGSSPGTCGVFVAFVLTEPARTTTADTAYSARRNIYRKLFGAVAPRQCTNDAAAPSTRNSSSSSSASSSQSSARRNVAWMSTVAIPPIGHDVHIDTSNSNSNSSRVVTSAFESEVGLPLARTLSNALPNVDVLPSSSMCFDDALIGWDKFPMHGPYTKRMGIALRLMRQAMWAYYYPRGIFRDVFAQRARERAAELETKFVDEPSTAAGRGAGSRVEGFKLRVVFVERRDSRRIINHNKLVAALRDDPLLFFPLAGRSPRRRGIVVVLDIVEITPQNMTMAEQVRAAAEADVLVGVNGAALTLGMLMLHCLPHCVLVELVPASVAFSGRTGWNANREGTFGGLMHMIGEGHHLLLRLPTDSRCHIIMTNGSDCVTLGPSGEAKRREDFPPEVRSSFSDVPPVPPPSLHTDSVVDAQVLRPSLASAACLAIVRGRWATKWLHHLGQAHRLDVNKSDTSGELDEPDPSVVAEGMRDAHLPPPPPDASRPGGVQASLDSLCAISFGVS